MNFASKPSTGEDCAMSSALPCGMPSTMSNSTTSPSSLRPTRWASVPPIWPEPINAILLRAMCENLPLLELPAAAESACRQSWVLAAFGDSAVQVDRGSRTKRMVATIRRQVSTRPCSTCRRHAAVAAMRQRRDSPPTASRSAARLCAGIRWPHSPRCRGKARPARPRPRRRASRALS